MPDELLSSWICRIAAGNTLIIRQFTRSVWPDISIWTRDIDLFAPEKIIQTLAHRCEIDYPTAFSTTLRSYIGIITPYGGEGLTQFITPIGVYHRIRKDPGQQWCPQCFIEDETPYWRRSWRLAFNTVCLKHGLVLADRCQDCGTPISPHRSLNFRCFVCEAHFSDHPQQSAKSVVLQLQGQINYVINGLCGDSFPFSFGNSHPLTFFRILSTLLRMLSSNPRAHRLRRVIEKHRDLIQMPKPVFTNGNRFEDLGVNSRQLVMERLYYLINGWPWMFIGYCQDSDFLWTWVTKDQGQKTAYELSSIADIFLSRHVPIRKGPGFVNR